MVKCEKDYNCFFIQGHLEPFRLHPTALSLGYTTNGVL